MVFLRRLEPGVDAVPDAPGRRECQRFEVSAFDMWDLADRLEVFLEVVKGPGRSDINPHLEQGIAIVSRRALDCHRQCRLPLAFMKNECCAAGRRVLADEDEPFGGYDFAVSACEGIFRSVGPAVYKPK